MRAAALRAALSAKVQSGRLIVVENLSQERPSTKGFRALLGGLGVEGRALVVTNQLKKDDTIARSCRNLPGVTLLPAQGLNVYDILKHDVLIMTRGALGLVGEAWKP